MVTLIVLEDGKEHRRTMPIGDAQLIVMKQDSEKMFGNGICNGPVVIGVESGDDDGFIKAILDCEVNPEEVRAFIETQGGDD